MTFEKSSKNISGKLVDYERQDLEAYSNKLKMSEEKRKKFIKNSLQSIRKSGHSE